MKDSQDLLLEKFDPHKAYGNLKKFNCENTVIDSFVRKSLRSQVRRNLSQCYVLVDAANNNFIVGFFTLTSFSVDAPMFKALRSGGLPSRVPCCRLVMLGVDKDYKKQGYGLRLMQAAFLKAVDVSNSIGVFGVFLDADKDAYDFYEKLGFIPLKERDLTGDTPMFLHIDKIKEAMKK